LTKYDNPLACEGVITLTDYQYYGFLLLKMGKWLMQSVREQAE